MDSTRILLGRTAAGDRVYVEVRLQEIPVRGPYVETIQHEHVAGTITRLSITGEVIGYRGREPHSCGQIRKALAEINAPAKGWTLDDIAELARIWDRWHLNDMRAACEHMTLPEAHDYDSRKHIVCPATGYRYGMAWLYEPLPADVLAYVRRLMTA